MSVVFRKEVNISTLDEVLKSSWNLLHAGVRDFRNPFHRPTLTTIDEDKPQARTVILREFSEEDRKLVCYCDVRGLKVLQIRDNPNVSWLFYDPKSWLQLRLSGTASVHSDDDTADTQWKRVRLDQRINYCAAMPPGSPTRKPTSGLPDFLRRRGPALLNSQDARKNFAAIVCRFDEMDWLLLKLTGHIRARFYWRNDGVDASWVVP